MFDYKNTVLESLECNNIVPWADWKFRIEYTGLNTKLFQKQFQSGKKYGCIRLRDMLLFEGITENEVF